MNTAEALGKAILDGLRQAVREEVQQIVNEAKQAATEDSLMSVKEAAAIIGCDKGGIWIYQHKDDLPFIVKVGKKVMVSRLKLQRWLAAQQ